MSLRTPGLLCITLGSLAGPSRAKLNLQSSAPLTRGYKRRAELPKNFSKGAKTGEYIIERESKPSKPEPKPRGNRRQKSERPELPEPVIERGPLPHIGRVPAEDRRKTPELRPRPYREGYTLRTPWNAVAPRTQEKGTSKILAPKPGRPEELAERPVLPSKPELEPKRFDLNRAPYTSTANPKKRDKLAELSEPPAERPVSSSKPNGRKKFASPPLLEGFLKSVWEILGVNALPTPIQVLSMNYLLDRPSHIPNEDGQPSEESTPTWRQALLAAETGSGKSIAYLLPMLQYLKMTEHHPTIPSEAPPPPKQKLPYNPRGLILAPTHELCRQLSVFAKSLLHIERLRVVCLSRANTSSSARGTNSSASQMKKHMQELDMSRSVGLHPDLTHRPADILVGTPAKVLELERGWGWNKADKIEDDWENAEKMKALNWTPSPPEMGLVNIEYVVIDEADILFNDDFRKYTRQLLADIARARGYNHPSFADLRPFPGVPQLPQPAEGQAPTEVVYPFNILLTSATIPASLSTYLTENHPHALRLASANLHRLPATIETEYFSTTGNKFSDIEKCVRRVWADSVAGGARRRPKILIFCNKSTTVNELHAFLRERSIMNVPLTSTSEARRLGSNRHLEAFLKGSKRLQLYHDLEPDVLITTSLLSRGLDFSSDIRYVFIVDEPIDMIDFIHRAGRSGRAGEKGHVIVFGKTKGRGSEGHKEAKKKISMLV
ncbi:hypothetical protein M422DRAFT_236456 [Sphaerobolus stellatus SS14]|uniref:ATP-dependent RNA helicase n=1 Tax=Sphaerobolus stellatus (strain SS14) TaxID=990650 RepID=A0A0C9UMR0_SPHS4|nr:hypothetical protein M422DRAFT_236456 [Sphaerobolus stellatus SS14]